MINFNMRFKSTYLTLFFCCLLLLSLETQAKQHSVAIFQFTATSMDVVGVENDVAYVVRNELRKNNDLSLLNQREMEVILMRNRIIQSFDVEQAINATNALDVNFVVLGTVSKLNGNILSHLALVSSTKKQKIASWDFSFSNQQDVLNRGKEMGEAINKAIHQFVGAAADNDGGKDSTWLAAVAAELNGEQSKITWQLAPLAPESLGFNIYRGLSKQGPFSYLASVLDPEYMDDVSSQSNTVYYQIALLTAEGEEFRSDKLAEITIVKAKQSSLSPPAILAVSHLIKGVEVEFLPSAQNVEQQVNTYQLIRRIKGSAWRVVNSVAVNTSTKSGAKSNEGQIQKYKLLDAQTDSLTSEVEYAVRAVSGDDLGNISTIYQHTPVGSPQLIDTGVVGVRQSVVKWRPVSSGLGYQLFRRPVGNQLDWQKIATIDNIEQSTYLDKEFTQEAQSFEYAIAVFDQYSTSGLSAPITLTSRGPLGAPTEFSVQNGQARKVTLHWTRYDDDALKGYAIFRTPFVEGRDVTLQKIAEVLDPQSVTYVDSTLEVDGGSFYYAVAAINAFGSSGDLTPVLKGTTKLAPKPILSLNAQIAENAIDLSWLPAEGQADAHYRVERRWQQTNWQSLVTLSGQTTHYKDELLLPRAEVEYRVLAIDTDELASVAVSSEVLVTPNRLTLIPQADGLLRQVNLRWAAIPVAEQLVIARRTKGQEWQVIAELEGAAQSYSDTSNMLDDTLYEYKIQVKYAQKMVSESDVLAMKTKNIPAPGELNIENGKARELLLSWAPNQDPDNKSYVVYRASNIDNYSAYKFLSEIPVTQASRYTDSTDKGGINHGEIYRYALASRNVYDVIGPLSVGVEGFTKALPSAPKNVHASADGNLITLSWQTGSETDLQTAEIYRRWKHETDWTLLEKVNSASNVYQDDKLLPYATVDYLVKLIDRDGLISQDSAIVSLGSPLATTLQAPSQGLLRQSSLQWTRNTQVETYKVLRSENNVSWQELATTTNSDYVDAKNLLDEKTYFYKLSLHHKGQLIGYSNIIEVKTKALPLPPNNIVVSSGQVKKVTLSWQLSDDPDVGGYIVYRQDGDGKLDELSKLKVTENRYVDEGGFFNKLEHGKSYSYVVTAFNTYKVEGPKSEVVIANTKHLPAQVSGLKANKTASNVELTWQSNSEKDLNEYIIFRGKTCSRGSKLSAVNSQTTRYTDTSIESGNEYCYYLIAKDADELESQPSTSASISIPNTGATQ